MAAEHMAEDGAEELTAWLWDKIQGLHEERKEGSTEMLISSMQLINEDYNPFPNGHGV